MSSLKCFRQLRFLSVLLGMGELTCLFFTVLFDNMLPDGAVSAGLDVDTKTAAALCLFSFFCLFCFLFVFVFLATT